MWAKAELRLRDALAHVGTAPVSLSLLALAAGVVATIEAWTRAGSAEGVHAFATSLACQSIAGALLIDAAVALGRVLSLEASGAGRVRFALERRNAAPIALRSAQMVAALAFVASLAGRERFDVRIAEGEAFTGGPEQLVLRDPPRPFSPGTAGIQGAVKEVRAAAAEGAGTVALLVAGGGLRTASSASPIWLGWGRFIWPVQFGWALRYELSGGVSPTESAFAKLQLFPPGRSDSIRMTEAPYRIRVRLAPDQPPPSSAPALEVEAYRGPLLVAEGALAPGDALVFEGGTLRFPEARRWVTLRVLRDPGIPLAAIAAALAIAGLGLRRLRPASVGRRSPLA